MTYRKRPDDNQSMMILALREAGFTVHDMSKCGWGIPDLIVCRAGRCEWVEVKSSSKGRLTTKERAFFAVCPGGKPILAWTPQQVISEFTEREKHNG